jgi:RND family efflux transporter MFP subunit
MLYRLMLLLAALVLVASVPPSGAMVHGESLECLIEPYVVVNIGTGVAGLLDTVRVERGDLVKQGQILATLESRVERAAIAVHRARATMESPIKAGEVRLELSARRHERNQGMFQKALIAADEMDEAEANRRLAEVSLLEAQESRRLAELELQRAQAELARRTIRSPITGVVVEGFLSPGERADEDPILKLAQLDPLHVEVFVPVERLGQIAVGMRAEVMPQVPIGGVYPAQVTVVDRMVDTASSMFGVRLDLPNPDYRLPAGLKCQVRFFPDESAQEHNTAVRAAR